MLLAMLVLIPTHGAPVLAPAGSLVGDQNKHQWCPLHGMGKKQLRWEKEKKVVPLVEQSQEILAWLGKLSYQ